MGEDGSDDGKFHLASRALIWVAVGTGGWVVVLLVWSLWR
jgi:hypothetical protein